MFQDLARSLTPSADRTAFPAWGDRDRLLFELLPDATLVLTADGHILDANAAASTMYGRSRSELTSMSVLDLRASDALEADSPGVLPQADLGSRRFQTRHRRRDGSVFPVDVTVVAALRDASPVFIEVVRDITQHEDVIQALLERGERLREMCGVAGVGLTELDPETRRIVRVNQTYCELTGYSEAELQVMRVDDLTHPDDLARDRAHYEALARAQAPYRVEKRYIRRDGAVIWVQVTVNMVRDAQGRPLRSIGVIQDITEHRRRDAALREGEERFRLLADQTPMIMWVTDPDGRLEFVNRAYSAFFGLPCAGAPSPSWPQLLDAETERHASEFFDALAQRRDFDHRARVRRVDGEWRLIVSHARPRYSSTGEFLGMVGTSQDVTDEERLASAQRDAARQKDAFIAVLAHELRNPLAPIRNAMAIFQARAGTDRVLTQARDVVERQVGHMSRLLDDLLDVSRLSRGKLSLQRSPVRLDDVIDAAIEIARPLVDQQRHILDVRRGPVGVAVDADGARLTQVFGNLLTNAARYTPPGGRITVTIGHDGGDETVVSVSDTGIGIPADMLGRVFELFTQVSHPYQQASSGLGIGLALARQLVEMHGGTLTVTSPGVGLGSTFSVALPSTPPVFAAEARSRAWSRAPWTRRRVLVADDNEDAADTLAMLLRDFGCDVDVVYGGQQARDVAERVRPQVMVLDLGMPDLCGHDVARFVRSQAWGRRVQIIAVTGWGHEDDRRRSAAAGFDAHLIKPVDPDLLLRTIHTGVASDA